MRCTFAYDFSLGIPLNIYDKDPNFDIRASFQKEDYENIDGTTQC